MENKVTWEEVEELINKLKSNDNSVSTEDIIDAITKTKEFEARRWDIDEMP